MTANRYMCLGCGRFWRMPDGIRPSFCPHCRDSFSIDNINDEIPEPLGSFKIVTRNDVCKHDFWVETLADLEFCPHCGSEINFEKDHRRVFDAGDIYSLKDIQKKMLSEVVGI